MRVDKASIAEFVSIAQQATVSTKAAKRILASLDLTQLSPFASESDCLEFCQQGHTPYGHVAAVCILPDYVSVCRQHLAHTNIKLATVANFPSGNESISTVLASIREATNAGARELDVVMPYQAYLAGKQSGLSEFVRACKIACGPKVVLKIIMETGALADPVLIAAASYDLLCNGADFLKTSTGKIQAGASLEAAATMLLTIKRAQKEQQRSFGLKLSGGISHLQHAVSYLNLADTIMGDDWVMPCNFRIGSSKLLDDILRYLDKNNDASLSHHG